MIDTVEYLGLRFSNLSYEGAASALAALAGGDRFGYVVTPNVDHIVQLHEGHNFHIRDRFRAAYRAADMRLCDSRVLQSLARLRKVHLKVVTGSDLTAYLFASGQFDDEKVALIGGNDATIATLRVRYPKVVFSHYQPPMGVLHNEAARADIVAFVAAAQCRYTLFCIGAPQSEILAYECVLDGRVRGAGICIGAAIEFLLGSKARAPSWMQRMRLEWAFRLMREPKRLWRRYLANGPKVFLIAMRYRLY